MRSLAYRTTLLGATLIVGAGLTLSACGGGSGGSGGGSGSGSTTVTIWSSVDPPVKAGLEKKLVAELAAMGSKIKIDWSTVTNINQLIITKIQAGNTPDIAYIPQPGVVAQMQSLGALKPLNSVVDMSSLQQNMVPGALDYGTINGQLYGLLGSANVKGLVWYNKPAWTAAGWQIPTSYAGLQSLMAQMKAKGSATAPWCLGINSTGSAGWPATDWFETFFMRDYGPTQYNEWVKHQIKFVSPQVENVASQFAQLAFTPGNVFGGRAAIDSNGFDTAGNGLFATPTPKCWMYMQGSFITGFFPSSVQSSLDSSVGVFYFPPTTAGLKPVEGGGDMLTMLNDNPSVETVVKLLSEPQIGNDAAPTSSFISPFKNFNVSLYPNDTTRAVASILYGASAFLFDASDSMPAQVGAGSFWSQMVAWIGNQESIGAALADIDSTWPASS